MINKMTPPIPTFTADDYRRALAWAEKVIGEYTGFGMTAAKMQLPAITHALTAAQQNAEIGGWRPIAELEPDDKEVYPLLIETIHSGYIQVFGYCLDGWFDTANHNCIEPKYFLPPLPPAPPISEPK